MEEVEALNELGATEETMRDMDVARQWMHGWTGWRRRLHRLRWISYGVKVAESVLRDGSVDCKWKFEDRDWGKAPSAKQPANWQGL